MNILSLILLIFILGVIIFIHELGHFFFAKKFGVHIYEFSLGMGPIILKRKGKDGIYYNLRAIPIGGFVSMAGEVYEDDTENKLPKEKFMCNKKWHQRVIILVAGVVMNFILAFVILFCISLFVGGGITTTTIESVTDEKPAQIAGIEPGDKVTEINGYKVSTWDKAQIVLYMKDDDNIYEFVVEHENGDMETINVEPEIIKDDNGMETKLFGISLEVEKTSGFVDSIKYAAVKFTSIVESMVLTITSLFTGKIGLDSLAGPIGMYEVVDVSAAAGVTNVIYLVAFLSINVGFLNILPFPAFDGGRVLFLIIEKIKGSPVNSKVENIFHLVGFALLMLLTIYIAIQDVIRLI